MCIISILLLQTVNIDATCSKSEDHKMISKIQECQKKQIDNLIEEIEQGKDSAIQESVCNWHDTMVGQCIKPNIKDCAAKNEKEVELIVDAMVVITLEHYEGTVYRLLSNCESVKELMTTNSATKKCNSHEMKLAKDNMLDCVKAQKNSWDNKFRNHRSASNLEKRYML